MSNGLLGIDLPAVLGAELGPLLLAATLAPLVAGARTPGQVSGGRADTWPTAHACRGMWERRQAPRRADGRVVAGDRVALLLSDGLPAGLVPAPGDRVSIEGATLPVVRLMERDPAGATFLLHCGER